MSFDGLSATVRQRVRIVGYTLGAATVLGMYLIVPGLQGQQHRNDQVHAEDRCRAHHPDAPTPETPTRPDRPDRPRS